MCRLRFLLFIPMLLGAAELKVDHATVAGRDLKTMMDNLARVGIRCDYGGAHSNHATEMAMTSFPDGSYLELIAPQPNAEMKGPAAHVWARQMQHSAGPCAWAVQSSDLAGEVKRLQLAGVTVGPPERSGRERPDGKRLEWEAAQIGEEPRGTFFPFVIRDSTPRQDRAFLNGKPTTKDFSGVTRVVIAVQNLRASVQRYRTAFALPAPIEQVDAGFRAHFSVVHRHASGDGNAVKCQLVAGYSFGAIWRRSMRIYPGSPEKSALRSCLEIALGDGGYLMV